MHFRITRLIDLRRSLVFALLSGLLLAATGCGSLPTAGYRRIATDSPEFKSALARATATELEAGKSKGDAESIAARRVREQMVKAEKLRRSESVVPLQLALDALDQPRGCWAYTLTTTYQENEKTTVSVERFDPFLPEDRIWTLVNRDGRPPTDDEQSSYRRTQLAKWKKQQAAARKGRTASERSGRKALLVETVDVMRGASGSPTTFSFMSSRSRVPLLGELPEVREAYEVDETTNRLINHHRTYLTSSSVLGGSVEIDRWEQSTTYAIVDPAVAAFPVSSRASFRIRAFGNDTGDVAIACVYSDYRRVKCYDDRFEVQIGVPSLQEFIPGPK